MPIVRTRAKSPAAFRTISEVSQDLEVPQHVLRFWETKFAQVRPLKRGGGRRYYRPEDVALLRHIRNLLYVDGYTIKGVQRLLRGGRPGNGAKDADAAEPAEAATASPAPRDPAAGVDRDQLKAVVEELEALRDLLRGLAK